MRWVDFALDLELASLFFLFACTPNHIFMFVLISIIILIRHCWLFITIPYTVVNFVCKCLLFPLLRSAVPSFFASEVEDCTKSLRTAISRSTLDSGKTDANTVYLLTNIVSKRPNLLPKAIELINEKITDNSINTSYLALDLLDKCVRASDFDFRFYVSKQAIDRVLKLAVPNHTTHPRVQRKAADLIRQWALAFGSDTRLSGFSAASAELSRHLPAASADKPAHHLNAPHAAAAARRPELSDLLYRARRLSTMSTVELVELASTLQRAIADRLVAVTAPDERRGLLLLQEQLAQDLGFYHARAAAAASSPFPPPPLPPPAPA